LLLVALMSLVVVVAFISFPDLRHVVILLILACVLKALVLLVALTGRLNG
jgi:hypothetical protein